MSAHDDEGAADEREIAVIGMSAQFPGARDVPTFWESLKQGREVVTFFSDEELAGAGVPESTIKDPRYVKAGMLLDDVESFDAAFFGYTPREAEIMDPQQRRFLEHAWQALEDAGYVPQRYDGLVGIYAGVAWNTYLLSNLSSHPELFDAEGAFQVFITNDKDFMPTRVSYKLNLKGPSMIIQTSCSTSLVAIHMACLSLLDYECDMALAGGVTIKVPQQSGYHYQEGGLASPDGYCRSFDADAQGTIFGSGIGVVALKRLPEALADGDHIYAVIKGSAINNDGSLKVSYTAPSVEGQAEVIAAAQAVARVPAESISYVEAHGTATALGDPIEVAALSKVFRATTSRTGFCALGSVKSNLGHLDAAAGVAGFIKTVLALKHRQIPPSLHYKRPNPAIDFANSPFYVNTALADWPASGTPRRAGVSSFGVGGTNAHVVVEEAPRRESDAPARPAHLLVLSARSESALEAAAARLADHLRQHTNEQIADVAYTLQVGRAVFRHRRALVCGGVDDALAALEGREPAALLAATDSMDPRQRPVAFLFPGQGAQHVAMGVDLYRHEPVFREHVDRCCLLLKPHLGLDLRGVLYPPPGEEESAAQRLGQTQLTQPALFVVEYAMAQLWMSWQIEPRALLGHSIGEYVAACLAGVFSLEDALALVAARGRLVQSMPPGAMVAVPLPEAELLPLLGSQLSLAAVNEPERCVVSGPLEAVQQLEQRLAEREIACRRLHTSHAFHSAMLDPILAQFRQEVQRVRLSPPQIPYISNVTGGWVSAEQATDPSYWVSQLRQTVRFAEGLQELAADPTRVLLEVGPGTTLSTLARRGAGQLPAIASARHPGEQRSDLVALLEALGQLWLAGVEVAWEALYPAEQRLRVSLPTYPFERQRYWIEPRTRKLDAATSQPLIKQGDPADWIYVPGWKQRPLVRPAQAAPEQRRWLVFAEQTGLSAELVRRLEQQGQTVLLVARGERFRKLDQRLYELNPAQRDGYDALLKDLFKLGQLPDAVVHCWSVTGARPAPHGADAFDQAQERGFYSLLLFAQALGRLDITSPIALSALSEGMASIAGETLPAPGQAPLAALCKVLAQEYPTLTARCVDVLPAEQSDHQLLADQLAEELAYGGSEPLVAYRAGRRWTQCFEPLRLEEGAAALRPLREEGVYLITGGLSEMGLALASALASQLRPRLVLLHDEVLPRREEWTAWLAEHEPEQRVSRLIRRLEELEARAGALLLSDAPLSDETALRALLDQVQQRFGALHGVIHAAGVEGRRTFQPIQELTPADCSDHFLPKVHGLLALEAALQGRELDFCLLVSSLASVLGGLGYAAYAAANSAMDVLAQRHNAQSPVPWITVNWDAWHFDDGYAQATTLSADLARLALSPEEGGAVFRRVVRSSPVEHVVISTGSLEARVEQWLHRRGAGAEAREQAQPAGQASFHPRPNLKTRYAAPETPLEECIARVWQQLLGIAPIGVHDNFFELGGDSFIAIRVSAQLQKELDMSIEVASLYEGLTIRALAATLERQRRPPEEDQAELADLKAKMQQRRQFQQGRRGAR